ncbi:YcaO-like family protein [Thalassobaculum sp.]|uniref:YcaO-like family protein n=1 Tax=Thalassobaculum sp. TaxID=2022740 RepID=UPI0032EBE800
MAGMSRTILLGAGADRIEPPSTTIARVLPEIHRFGVTRLADLTGLDVLGIPVWSTSRPNGRSLSVTAGKGESHEAARASAVMEAVEYDVAERPEIKVVRTSRADLVRSLGTSEAALQFDGLQRCSLGMLSEEAVIDWVEGLDLSNGRPIWAPWRLVTLDQRVDGRAEPFADAFHVGSNGLASGNSRAEAIFHALCECVEEDAIALWRLGGEGGLSAVRPEEFGDITVDDLVGRIRAAAAVLRLFDVTAPDLAVPAYLAVIGEASTSCGGSPIFAGLTLGGYGCHPDPRRAVVRAITEAAQARLVTIAGARDDLTRKSFAWQQGPAAAALRKLLEAPETRSPRSVDVGFCTSGSIEERTTWVVSRLADVGLGPVVVVPLETAASRSLGVFVVRVIVRGIEADPTAGARQIGARALKSMLVGAGRATEVE